jgi:hypothetical protein
MRFETVCNSTQHRARQAESDTTRCSWGSALEKRKLPEITRTILRPVKIKPRICANSSPLPLDLRVTQDPSFDAFYALPPPPIDSKYDSSNGR